MATGAPARIISNPLGRVLMRGAKIVMSSLLLRLRKVELVQSSAVFRLRRIAVSINFASFPALSQHLADHRLCLGQGQQLKQFYNGGGIQDGGTFNIATTNLQSP